ncbi:MAG: polysaccharide deacetylase family protein [Magnetococcales bacterium]|nr:polysaccharide deacetylase family protein [Magnetococcales bacterium]
MSISIAFARRVAFLVFFLCGGLTLSALHAASDEPDKSASKPSDKSSDKSPDKSPDKSADKSPARYDTSQFTPHYLYPGGEVVLSVDALTRPEDRVMSITFDDGPDEKDLETISVLEKHGVPATFFYLGTKVKALPEIVKKVHERHHEIGYHSFRHNRLRWFSQTTLAEDFRQGKEALTNLGVPLSFFRPPYGDFTESMVRMAKDNGMETILWTIDSRDWTGIGAETMARNVIRHFHPGAVLLFHSQHAVTLRALPMVLEAAERENYRFVSLGDWRQTVLAANCRVLDQSPCPAAPIVAARPAQTKKPSHKARPAEAAPISVPAPVRQTAPERVEEPVSAEPDDEPTTFSEGEEEVPVISQVIDSVVPVLTPISIVHE